MKINFPNLYILLGQLLLIFSLNIFAQSPPEMPKSNLPNPFDVYKKYLRQSNYITPVFELKANEEKYLASPIWKVPYLEVMSLLEGYGGNYDEAYAYENLVYESNPGYINQRKRLAAEIAASPLADYKRLDALDAIENAAKTHQVIMINEEHRTPFHRAVTLQLLSRLYAQGFRYFAAETVDEKDTELNKRGYSTQQTGFYTADPIYADAIRTALKIGYKVVPYESMDQNCKSPADNPEFCNDRREREQAQNLNDHILKNDPQAKIFVHVGRSHNSKAAISKDFNFMAYYFQQISGIEPFTIDQLHFSERRNPADEQPLYRYLTKNNLLLKPSVYQSASGSFFNQTASGNDVVIFHPRMTYENGRAIFLKMNGMRTALKINLSKLKLKATNRNLFGGNEPVLIQAFYRQESTDAVPVDQIILYPEKKIPVLILPKGKFLIRTMNKTGAVTGEYRLTR